MLPCEANSSRASPAWTPLGTGTANEVALVLRDSWPTNEIVEVGGGGGGRPATVEVHDLLEADHLQVLVPGATGEGVLVVLTDEHAARERWSRAAVVAVIPSVRSQSSELVPLATRKEFT